MLLSASCLLLLALQVGSYLAPAWVPMNLHMLLASGLTIYVAAHLGLVQEAAEEVTDSTAYSFPVFAGLGLGGLYLAFKFLDAWYVNMVLRAYFALAGLRCVADLVHPLVASVVSDKQLCASRRTTPIIGRVVVTPAGLVSFVISAAVCGGYVVAATLDWPTTFLLNNVLGMALCVEGIKSVSMGTYRASAIMLVGLFVYDIVMVFGTDALMGKGKGLMVTVATKVDGPIKLLFPRGFLGADGKQAMSLLGLGDIVVPGLFLAMLLRYDAFRALSPVPAKAAAAVVRAPEPPKDDVEKKKAAAQAEAAIGSASITPEARADLPNASFPKPFFNAAWLAYSAGLMVTSLIMIFFESAQPALLYLVPATLLASLGVALVKKDVGGLFAYGDDLYANLFKPEEAAEAPEQAEAGAKPKSE